MILIALGGNMPLVSSAVIDTLHAALKVLPTYNIAIEQTAPFYRSAPVPMSDQPWFINSMASVQTPHTPRTLMDALLEIERKFGRTRGILNAARTLDLDIIDYKGLIQDADDLILPHPRLESRAFVLHPLRDIAPRWRHPVSGLDSDTLIKALPKDQMIERMA